MSDQRPLGQGREADVFLLSSGLVARRYRDQTRSTEVEAGAMSYARAAGFPVPRVVDADGPLIVMDLVPGPTMASELSARPLEVRRHLATLAMLHKKLHAIEAPAWLRSPCDEGTSLLHLDLHPGNVILSPDGPQVIDWSAVGRGPANVDVAMTWVVFSSSFTFDFMANDRTLRVARMVAKEFARHFDAADIASGMPRAVELRLLDQTLVPEEREKVRQLQRASQLRLPRRPRWGRGSQSTFSMP